MSPLARSNHLAARMGRWSAGHWKTAVFGWLAFVVVAVFAGQAIGTKTIPRDDTNVGEARRADHILKDAGFKSDPQTEIVLIQGKRLTIHDATFRAAVNDTVATVGRFNGVKNLRSPLDPAHADQIAADGHTALVEWEMRGSYDSAKTRIDAITAATDGVAKRHPAVFLGEAGSISSGKALDAAFTSQLKQAGTRSLPLTLLVLLLVFGALVAAGVPLLLALSAVMATLGGLALPSHLIPLDPNVDAVVLLVGLAVGVDYSLFYLKREREERRAGRSAHAALEAAAATSGRSVLISGLTVIIAMAGMLFSGDRTFMGFGLATMLVVAIAMLGSLTVLPALLSKLGDRVEKGRIPFLSRAFRGNGGESRFWNGVLTPALRRPAVSLVIAGGALLALASPVLHLHTAQSGLNSIPKTIKTVPALQKINAAFPGGATPAEVAIRAKADSPQLRAAIGQLRQLASATSLMGGPVDVAVNAGGTATRVSIPLAGNGTDATSTRALRLLRDNLLPQTVGRVPGAEYAVTGGTAGSVDFNRTVKHAAPIVFGFVLTFAFLLLLISFRSIVIAAKAIVLNLLSVGAAYGLMILVFQDGWGEGILNFQSTGGIAAWLPIFMFVILFGLSMDYHVFILSRVREAYDRGLSSDEAVAHGIKTSAGVVTSAAIVMVGVFGIFATLPILDMKEMGIGLAAAVLIDATIVRAVLLPAAMKLLGDWNWYLPRWLEWLPRLEHEQAPEPVPEAAPAFVC